MKKKPYLYYIKDSYSKKRLLLIGISVLVLILVIYFVFFNKQAKPILSVVETIPQFQKSFLDERFFVLYGKITKVSTSSVDIEVIEDQKLTEYIFNSTDQINLSIGESLNIKKFDLNTKKYFDLNITDIKVDNFITAYINKATSSGYKAIGIKVFDQNIIEY
jgi:hypothetical protein